MGNFETVLVFRWVLSIIFALLVLVYYLLLLSNRISLSKKSVFVIGLAALLFILFQTLVDIFTDFGEFDILYICGGGVFTVFAFLAIFVGGPKICEHHEIKSIWFGSFVVIALFLNLLVPIYLSNLINSKCNHMHQELAQLVIDALNSYKNEKGVYPKDVKILIPEYLSELPTPNCFSIYRPFLPKLLSTEFLRSLSYEMMMEVLKLKRTEYYVVSCEWDEDGIFYEDYYLFILAFDLNGKQRYNFATDDWEIIPYNYSNCAGYSNSD